MIVGICFAGDRNDKLKWIQHDLYDKLMVRLFTYSKARYYTAVRVLGVETELRRRVSSIKSFDHRVLQEAHDKIAAYYRFAHDPRGQMPLPFDGLSYEEYLMRGWCMFFDGEVERLVEMDEVPRTILTAVAYQNTPVGYQSEDRLMAILTESYGNFDSARWNDERRSQVDK